MPICMFILTYVCVVLEPSWLTASVGRDEIGCWASALPGQPNSGKCWEMIPVLLTLGEPMLKSLKGHHKWFCGHILTS